MFENFGQNSPELNEKKNILDSCSSFGQEQNWFCGKLENYTIFCLRKRVLIEPLKLFFLSHRDSSVQATASME